MSRRNSNTDIQPRVDGFSDAPQSTFDAGVPDIGEVRVRSTLDAARSAGFLEQKTARVSGRISPALIARAKRRTGMTSDSELIEFALASVALDDPFMEVFRRVRGTIDPDIELGF